MGIFVRLQHAARAVREHSGLRDLVARYRWVPRGGMAGYQGLSMFGFAR